jgi:hypothetical protein
MSGEIEPEELREELDTIKEAMGLQERYGSELRVWLVYAVLVGLASLGSQAVVTLELPPWGHWLSWGAFIGAGVVYQTVALGDDYGGGDSTTRPGLGLQYGAVLAYAVVVLAVVAPLFPGTSAALTSSVVFAIAVGAVGTAYVLAGNLLTAYRIRRRDRVAFYVGGVWMLALAVLLPRVAFLQRWGYAVFGVAFAVHAVSSYLALR